jgi:hypothetical protein
MEVLDNVKDKKRLWKPLNSKSCNGKAVCYTTVGPNGCNCIGFVVDVVLVFFRSGRKASSYLLASERTKHLR